MQTFLNLYLLVSAFYIFQLAVISYFVVAEGLKATEAETIIPKGPAIKKKGKKSSARHRPVRLTNVHLKGDIDLSRDYTPTSK